MSDSNGREDLCQLLQQYLDQFYANSWSDGEIVAREDAIGSALRTIPSDDRSRLIMEQVAPRNPVIAFNIAVEAECKTDTLLTLLKLGVSSAGTAQFGFWTDQAVRFFTPDVGVNAVMGSLPPDRDLIELAQYHFRCSAGAAWSQYEQCIEEWLRRDP